MITNPSDTNALHIGQRWQQLLKFATPNMLMMLSMALYSIVDAIFIGRYLGSIALSALNMVFPVFSLLFAAALMISTGGSAVVARLMGEGREERAQSTFSMLILIMACISATGAAVSLPFMEEILALLGCTDIQMPHAYNYAFLSVAFGPMFFLQAGFQFFFVTAGKPHLGMILIMIGGVTNIVLDYVFLAQMNWGIEGAALATGIGASVTAVGGLVYFSVKQSSSLCFVRPRLRFKQFVSVCVNGLSEMVSNLSNGLTTWLFNLACLSYYGEQGVAAIGIIIYLQFFCSSLYFGYAEGVAPVISYHLGARNRNLLAKVFRSNIVIIFVISISVFVITLVGIDDLLHLFLNKPEENTARELAKHGFLFYVYAYLLMGFNLFSSAHFTALGNGPVSGIIAFVRTFVFLAGCIILLPKLMGANGIWLAAPVAELLSLAVSYYFLRRYRSLYGYW